MHAFHYSNHVSNVWDFFTGMAASFVHSTSMPDLGKAKRQGGAGSATGVSVSTSLRNAFSSSTGSASVVALYMVASCHFIQEEPNKSCQKTSLPLHLGHLGMLKTQRHNGCYSLNTLDGKSQWFL